MEQFFLMGGFADYVWPAFGITAIVLLGLFISTYSQYKKMISAKNKKRTTSR